MLARSVGTPTLQPRFYLVLGASRINLDINTIELGRIIDQPFTIKTSTDLAWSVGGHLTALECGSTTFGIETQYFYTSPDISELIVPDFGTFFPRQQ